MQVVCINEFSGLITHNRVYKVHDENFNRFLITDDMGNRKWYYKKNFKQTDKEESITEEQSLKLKMLYLELERLNKIYQDDVKIIIDKIKETKRDNS